MNFIRYGTAMGLAAGLAFATVGGVAAQTAEEFYKGNTITVVVPATPGGGSDFFARAFAPYLAKHLPGQPGFRVENLPGAGGMTAAIQLQNLFPKDGTKLVMMQRNSLYMPLVSSEEIAYDPRKVDWLGSLSKESYFVTVRSDAPATTAEELFTTTVRTSATAFSNENRTLPAMMNEYYGTKFDIVAGYDGNAAAVLAMEQNEVQGKMVTGNTLLGEGSRENAMWKEGATKVVLQVGVERHPEFPDVPNIFDFQPTAPDGAEVAQFLLAPMDAGRPFAIPQGVPEDRVAALEAAFLAASEDPEFLAEMAAAGITIEVISGAAVEQIVTDLFAKPEPVIAKVKALVAE